MYYIHYEKSMHNVISLIKQQLKTSVKDNHVELRKTPLLGEKNS